MGYKFEDYKIFEFKIDFVKNKNCEEINCEEINCLFIELGKINELIKEFKIKNDGTCKTNSKKILQINLKHLLVILKRSKKYC